MFHRDSCKICGACITKCPNIEMPKSEARKQMASFIQGQPSEALLQSFLVRVNSITVSYKVPTIWLDSSNWLSPTEPIAIPMKSGKSFFAIENVIRQIVFEGFFEDVFLFTLM